MSWKLWEKHSNPSAVPTIDPVQISNVADAPLAITLPCNAISGFLPTTKAAFQPTAGSSRVPVHPCEFCGACCAFFLVSFPSSETDDCEGGFVPLGMSGCSSETKRFMNGTEIRSPRCIALHGVVGTRVACRIYEKRPTTCRAFNRSWENDTGNTLCDRARSVFGLQPFSQY